ncbi:MAG: right-handed parallel beta-helix repeat-containing protein [Deltaproteobacteria bacterium]|nr:right-handed parallel beta-helix repeat-containing protein [Deltaproteobacteria bacterium]
MIRRIAVVFAAVSLAACSGGTKGSSGSTASSTASSTTATITTASSGTSGSASTGTSGSTTGSTSGSTASASSGSSGASTSGSGSSGSTGEGGPVITSVTVEGAAAAEVRQGATANAHIHGINLDNATAVQLGTTALTPSSDTATEIVAPVTAPHGATLGALDLTVTTPNGSTVDTGAITFTPIVVSPSGDDTAPGVPSAPYKTITQALTVAQSGDTVQLMAGTFGSSAEAFPSGSTPASYTCNVKDGVTLAGVATDAGNPLILDEVDGGSATASPIVPCGSMSLSDVDVQGFGYGAVVIHGSMDISNMHQSGAAQDGLYASGVNALLSIATNSGAAQHSSFLNNGASGLHVLSQATLTAGGFDATGNAQEGVRVEGGSSSSVRFARLDQNVAAGAYFSGNVLVNMGPSVEANGNGQGVVFFNVTRTSAMDGVTIEGNTGDGLAVLGNSGGVNVTNSFVDTNLAGLHIDTDGGAVSVGTTNFVVNTRGVLVRGNPTSVNLNATGSGSNTVRGNQVNLDVDVTASALVSMRGVVFDGTDGGAFPDASPSGGETWGWTYPPGDAGIQYISSTGLSLAPLEWDPDAGEGPFNYLLWDGGGSIQF